MDEDELWDLLYLASSELLLYSTHAARNLSNKIDDLGRKYDPRYEER